jgi:hypothetical protein
VFDEAIVPKTMGRATRSSSRWVMLRRALGRRRGNFKVKPSRKAVISAFKAYLAEDKLPDEVIEGTPSPFATVVFFLVKTEPHRADQVITIMRDCAAVRADRHG